MSASTRTPTTAMKYIPYQSLQLPPRLTRAVLCCGTRHIRLLLEHRNLARELKAVHSVSDHEHHISLRHSRLAFGRGYQCRLRLLEVRWFYQVVV